MSEKPEDIVKDIEHTRQHLAGILDEVTRRRRRMFDWRAQVDQHKSSVMMVGAAGGVLLIGGITWAAISASRRRHRNTQMERLRRMVVRVAQHPDDVARQRFSVWQKILAAGGSALASLVVRELTNRLLHTRPGVARAGASGRPPSRWTLHNGQWTMSSPQA